MTLLLNIDVPDVKTGVRFYTSAFGLTVGRRFGTDFVELLGWPVTVYLLAKAAGTTGAGGDKRWLTCGRAGRSSMPSLPSTTAASLARLAIPSLPSSPVRYRRCSVPSNANGPSPRAMPSQPPGRYSFASASTSATSSSRETTSTATVSTSPRGSN